MQVTTRLLKKGAKRGLTLHQIALLMVRLSPNEPSSLEKVVRLSVSQACYANFATSYVHRRDLGMKYVMDLAGASTTVAEKESFNENSSEWSGRGKFTRFNDSQTRGSIRLADRPGRNELFASDHESEDAPTVKPSRPRSKTLSRLPDGPSGLKTRETKFRKWNYTALRGRDEAATSSLDSLWILHDAGGRVVNPEWSEKRYQRLFFEAFDGMLDFLLSEKFK